MTCHAKTVTGIGSVMTCTRHAGHGGHHAGFTLDDTRQMVVLRSWGGELS